MAQEEVAVDVNHRYNMGFGGKKVTTNHQKKEGRHQRKRRRRERNNDALRAMKKV